MLLYYVFYYILFLSYFFILCFIIYCFIIYSSIFLYYSRNRTIILTLRTCLSANAGMFEGTGQRIPVETAPGATAKVRPVSHQRIAAANLTYRSTASGRAAVDATERHQHLLRSARPDCRSLDSRSNILVLRREDITR